MLGANDRKMQKSSSNISTSKLFVAPRDHFLDNAGMSEDEADLDAVEEGMLIEAPVTPEKSLPASAVEGSPGPDERQQAASQEGSQEASRKADGAADGAADGVAGTAGQAIKTPETGRQDQGMEKEKSMGVGSNSIPRASQVCTATSLWQRMYDCALNKAIDRGIVNLLTELQLHRMSARQTPAGTGSMM